jgi:transcriptional regulator NrdR family protein
MSKLQCPYCKGENTSVYSTRQYEDKIKRYRKCNDCNQRFTTVEKVPSHLSAESAIKKIKNIVDKF